MGRIYVCPIVGIGTADDPQRAKAENYVGQGAIGVRACISVFTAPDDPQRGKPRFSWTICYVEATNWAALDADTQLINLIELVSGSAAVLDQTVPAPIKARLRQENIVTQEESSSITTFRSAINLLIKKHYPGQQLEAALLGKD